jgi:Bacterial Ig-like domain (group 3)/FG-GAP-like repeat
MRKLLKIFAIAFFTLAFTAALSIYLLMRSPVRAGRLDLQAVARKYPNFTIEQRMAILRLYQSEMHPHWKDLSAAEIVRRIVARVTASSNGLTPPANFSGNVTAIALANNHLMSLAQQADCSLTLRDSVYTFNATGPVFSYVLAASTPHYEQVLHTAAGLTTTGGNYPAGCGDTTTGTPSREAVGGATSSGVPVYAGNFYYGENQAFQVAATANGTFQSFHSLGEVNNVVDITISDLNGDGNSDLVLINDPLATTGNATISISLGKADGTFPVPTEITLPGNYVYSAVIDDFNGDGKKDIVASSSQGYYEGQNTTYSIEFLAGNGDGTFQAVKSYTVTPPANFIASGQSPYFGLISADLRGSGHKDLITSTGIVLFGNGDGTFTPSPTPTFPNSTAASDFGPSVVAADFNKDGKLDLAVNTGAAIQIYLGKGDGTFTLYSGYSTVGNMGYLVAQDIDGDGNIDLYSGTGNNGTLGGDKFDYNMGYALMGNGDGTFRGATAEPFTYSGSNLADLNGDKAVDAVGVNSNGSFTSYLGDGKGDFAQGPSLVFSPITLGGKSYTISLDSYALGDINGDGIPDLVYLGTDFYGPNYVPGIFTAAGKGDGSFNTPTFTPAPPFVAPPDIDVNPTISAIQLADMNHDGKLDLVYTYSTTSYKLHTSYFGVAVQLGNGDGTFKSTAELTQLYSGATVAGPGAYTIMLVGDVNKDGTPDMLIGTAVDSAALDYYSLQVYLGKGDGTFGAPTVVAGVTPQPALNGVYPLTLADMNNDGIPDIVALEEDPTTTDLKAAIALGNGDGTFKTPNVTVYAAQCFYCGLAVADFNGDGKLDVAIADYIGGPQGSGISFGNGDGTLQTSGTAATGLMPVQSFYIGVNGASLAIDLNGDGKPDILDGNVVLLNQGVTTAAAPAATTTALTASASTITAGGSVTLTATITGASGSTGTPTGTVTFLDGTTTLGMGTLNTSGVTTYSAGALATGAHSITAQYGGDSNFAASTSTAITVTVQAIPPSFSISASPASLSITAGATGTSTVSVKPAGGFAQPVTFACTGLPSEATCTFAPATVTPGASAVTTTLTITTMAAQPSVQGGIHRAGMVGILALGSLLLLVMPGLKRVAGWSRWFVLLLALMLGGGLIGCGGGGSSGGGGTTPTNPGTPSGTTTVTVTATSGSINQTASLQMTVQ